MRTERLPDKSHEGRRVGLLTLILLSTIGLVALYQWQEPLRALWQTQVVPWVGRMSEEVPAMVMGDPETEGELVELEERDPDVVPTANTPESIPTAEVSEPVEPSSDIAAEEAAIESGTELASPAGVEPQRPPFDPALAEPIPLTPVVKTEERQERLPSEPSPAAADTADTTTTADTADTTSAAEGGAIAEMSRTAEAMVNRGDWTGALALLESGLETYPDNPRLLMQRERVQTQMDRRYREVATENAEDAEAAEPSRLESTVAAIEDDLAAGRLEEAGERLMQARERNPGSAELLALEVEWRDRQEAELRPEINRARVSVEPLDSLTGEQANVLPAGRVLYVGFTYRNFAATSAVIQAMLYDGSRQIQIAQVPVIVQGPEGEAFFRIERPVNGFAEGGYHLDLVADERTLSSISFQITD